MMATLMATIAAHAIRCTTLAQFGRRPYEKVLQGRRTRPACQADMASGIEHELSEILGAAVSSKLFCDLDPQFDIPLRMLQHVGDLRGQVVLVKAVTERLRLRELLLEKALLVCQAQGPEAKCTHRPIVR